MPGDAGLITPVLTTKVVPGRPYKMCPKAAFFVAHIPSTAVEPSRGYISSAENLGPVASIDFTGLPKEERFAEVILDDEGHFRVKYAYIKRR